MYIKVFNRILHSSLAENRTLRHFFIDLMLCSDPDGNVVMTKQAIANMIRAPLEEVEHGLAELMKPDPESLHQEFQGRRVIPLDGHGYGWKIINYEHYRDMKTAEQMRRDTAERVKRHREKKRSQKIRRSQPLPGEAAHLRSLEHGAEPVDPGKIAEDQVTERKTARLEQELRDAEGEEQDNFP